MNKNNLFRLATVLYADNNYEVSPKTIIKKVIESALLLNENKPINIHQLIDLIFESYHLHVDELEIKNIVTSDKEEGFVTNVRRDEITVFLSEKRFQLLESKLSKKTIEYFIELFESERIDSEIVTDVKEVIYRFLYEILNSNIESFKKLINSKNNIEELINIESFSYNSIEREIVNDFLKWDNDEKNKAIFDISSYGLEYCMISNKGDSSQIHLNNLKNKIFYLDANVIFRALGINGLNRQNRTLTFLKKITTLKTSLVISSYTEQEFKDTITFYLDKLKRNQQSRKINPEVFNEKYFNNISQLFDFYFKWRAGKFNDSLELFEAYIFSLYEKYKKDFRIEVDFKIPFDELNESVSKKINDLSVEISTYKHSDGAKHGANGDIIDAKNILLIETKREGKCSNIFETKQFIISTDQSLRRWDYHRNSVTPIVILPSQWLSIILRYVERTSDDFKSFVSFLNLPSGETQIQNEKLQIVLAGISEMTENFEEQKFLVQTLVQKRFDGILEKGIKDDEILERTIQFVKNELVQKIENIELKNEKLNSDFIKHKENSTKTIKNLELIKEEHEKLIHEGGLEKEKLKESLRNKFIEEKLKTWRSLGYWFIPLTILIILFFYLQIFYTGSKFNIVFKFVKYIDNHPSDTIKEWLRHVFNTGLMGGLVALNVVSYNRIFSKEKALEKRAKILENLPSEYK